MRRLTPLARGMVLVAAFGAGLLPAPAQKALNEEASSSEALKGPEIHRLFNGNTVSGLYMHGGYFSEYHASDGRALGDNGHQINTDACWNVDLDRVCYHYGKVPDRRTYCFRVEKNGDALSLIAADSGRLNAVGKVEKGNPSGHGDGGRRWSCDDLLSMRAGKLVVARNP